MSKLALMGRALNPLRRLALTRRFSVDTGGDQTTPPPPLEAAQPPPPTVEAAQQDQTPPPPQDQAPPVAAELPPPPQDASYEAAQQDQTPPPPQDQAAPVAVEPPPPQDASYDPLRQGSGEGLVFGRLTGVGKHTMKTDVIHFLEGSNLSIDDVKVEYNRALSPVAMMLRFTSRTSYGTALREIARKGRLYRLDTMIDSVWDSTSTFNGRTVLLQGLPCIGNQEENLQGLPRTANQEDIERFLSGFNFDPTSIQINRTNGSALVSFQSRLDAMNALTTKNRSFCLNNPITMRILH